MLFRNLPDITMSHFERFELVLLKIITKRYCLIYTIGFHKEKLTVAVFSFIVIRFDFIEKGLFIFYVTKIIQIIDRIDYDRGSLVFWELLLYRYP